MLNSIQTLGSLQPAKALKMWAYKVRSHGNIQNNPYEFILRNLKPIF